MKRTFFFIFITIILSALSFAQQNVGINPNGFTPNSSAGLDVDYQNKGVLIPRVNLLNPTDAITIPSPAHSLLVFNLGSGGLSPAGFYYNSGTPSSPLWVMWLAGTSSCGLVNYINPYTLLNSFTGYHPAQSPAPCVEWQYADSYCSCGQCYDWDWGYCYSCSYTSNVNNGCPCVTYAGFPTNTQFYLWQTANLTSVVPAGTRFVLAQADWAISTPDYGDVEAFLLFRKNTSSPTYVGAKGRSSSSRDNIAASNQFIIEIDPTNLTFQYAVEFPGFNQGINFSIIGYY